MNRRRALNGNLFEGMNIDEEEENGTPRGPREGVTPLITYSPNGVLPKGGDPELDGGTVEDTGVQKRSLAEKMKIHGGESS